MPGPYDRGLRENRHAVTHRMFTSQAKQFLPRRPDARFCGKWPARGSVRIRGAAIPCVAASRESTRKPQPYFRAA